MSLISDRIQNKKLKEYNINIKTKYIVNDKILERNSNHTYCDDIKNGIRCEKQYFLNDKLIKIEKQFDSRIKYTFISKEQENKEYTCPNCGLHSTLRDFVDGCPYCRTYYNLDYTEKDLGGKYHYDRIIRSTKYRVITALVDLLFSLGCSAIFIRMKSRTFNSYDVSKIFIYGIILSLILYYFFYIVDGYIVLGPIKKYKDKQNEQQKAFWNRTHIDKNKFFNNLNYEVGKKYFQMSDVIDYDIIDYDWFHDNVVDHVLNVEVKAYVRIVKYQRGKLTSNYIVDTYHMKKKNDEVLEMKEGTNIIQCHHCGASIDATKGLCEYCRTPIKPLQEWVMD